MTAPARIIAAAAALLALAGPAEAQTARFYDQSGRSTGRAETRGTSTRFYDAKGRSTGRAEQGSDGTVRTFDERGRSSGRIERPARRREER